MLIACCNEVALAPENVRPSTIRNKRSPTTQGLSTVPNCVLARQFIPETWIGNEITQFIAPQKFVSCTCPYIDTTDQCLIILRNY